MVLPWISPVFELKRGSVDEEEIDNSWEQKIKVVKLLLISYKTLYYSFRCYSKATTPWCKTLLLSDYIFACCIFFSSQLFIIRIRVQLIAAYTNA